MTPTKSTPSKRGGAPAGNLNAARNGSRVARLTVGEFPPQLHRIKTEARRYRRAVETEVLAARGEIDVVMAHCIDTAAAATAHAGICRWLLRRKIGEMTPQDILACSRELVRAKQARDQAIRALGLVSRRERRIELAPGISISAEAAASIPLARYGNQPSCDASLPAREDDVQGDFATTSGGRGFLVDSLFTGGGGSGG